MTSAQAKKFLDTTRQSYDAVAQDFATTRVFSWPEAELFLPYIKKLSGPLVVGDLGCGNGRMVEWVKKLGAKYVGVDSSDGLLHIARSHFPLNRFLLADLTSLPLESNSLDVCLLNASLHHLPTPLLAPALAELQRVLKPGGLICMVNWNLWQTRFVRPHIAEWFRQLTWRSKLGWQDFWVSYSSPDQKTKVNRFYHGFTGRELSRLATEHHFQVLLQGYVYKNEFVSIFTGRNLLSVWQKP